MSVNHKRYDLALAAGLALVAIAFALMGLKIPLLSGPLAAVLVLLLPGYALTAAIYPWPTLGLPERALLSLGLSLTLSALSGLLLNLLPGGLSRVGWTLLLAALTLAACAIAQVRRGRRPRRALPGPGPGPGWRNSLRYAPALLVLGSAFGVAVTGALNEPKAGFTQLWMLPVSAESRTVQLGVRNSESAPTGYRLELRVAGQRVEQWEQLRLAPGESWETRATLPEAGWAEAVLYREDAPEAVYRRTLLQDDLERTTTELRP